MMRMSRAALSHSYRLALKPMCPKCVSFLTLSNPTFPLSKGRLSCYTVAHIRQK